MAKLTSPKILHAFAKSQNCTASAEYVYYIGFFGVRQGNGNHEAEEFNFILQSLP